MQRLLHFLSSLLFFGYVFGSSTDNATDLVDLVNLFIGTASGANGGSGGNAFPGAAVPHAMAKVGIYSKPNTPIAQLLLGKCRSVLMFRQPQGRQAMCLTTQPSPARLAFFAY